MDLARTNINRAIQLQIIENTFFSGSGRTLAPTFFLCDLHIHYLLFPAMKSFRFIALLAAAASLAGCARETPQIGRGEPRKEIRQCIALGEKGHYEDSIQCLEMFKARYPQTQLAREAELMIGDAYFSRKDYLLAAETYQAFLRLHPLHRKADYAHYRIGVSYFKESPKAIDRDQRYLKEAVHHLRIVLRRYPGSKYRDAARAVLLVARRRLARRHYYIGRFYYRTGEYIACIPRFMEVANRYPDSGLADKALYMAIKANLGLDRLEAAKETYSTLATKYPKSRYVKRAERKLLRAVKKS